ncbi:MAG: peptide ABC transporter substrate-binding protein, partial [Dehalococcoidia bacterium]|nr:peptide ABC transporter substrate-binding protein [Dehalococcoidia bacterium]
MKRCNHFPSLSIVLLVILVVVFPLLAGCQPEGEAIPPATSVVPTVSHSDATSYPSPEGTLTLFDVEPATLDPAISHDATSHTYVLQLFSGLVTLDARLNVVPDIANDWDISADGMVYTFHLCEGAQFHDGRKIKAQDFKYSWERACDPRLGSLTAGTYLGDIVGVREVLSGRAREISGVRVIDDSTLEVSIDAPKMYFLAKMTYPTAFVVDETNVASGEEWWHKPNGSGPFKLQRWLHGEELVLECNSHYYRKPALLKQIVFKLWAGDPMIMYEKGEIDATYVGRANIDRVGDAANPLSREMRTISELS